MPRRSHTAVERSGIGRVGAGSQGAQSKASLLQRNNQLAQQLTAVRRENQRLTRLVRDLQAREIIYRNAQAMAFTVQPAVAPAGRPLQPPHRHQHTLSGSPVKSRSSVDTKPQLSTSLVSAASMSVKTSTLPSSMPVAPVAVNTAGSPPAYELPDNLKALLSQGAEQGMCNIWPLSSQQQQQHHHQHQPPSLSLRAPPIQSTMISQERITLQELSLNVCKGPKAREHDASLGEDQSGGQRDSQGEYIEEMESSRPRRATRKTISYKEPSGTEKIRKGHVFFKEKGMKSSR